MLQSWGGSIFTVLKSKLIALLSIVWWLKDICFKSGSNFYFRSCCGPLLYHLLLRGLAETSVLATACGLSCYWLHNDSASSTAHHNRQNHNNKSYIHLQPHTDNVQTTTLHLNSNGVESRVSGKEMFKATCSECNQECEVPFKPDPSRPVYCRECWAKKRPARPRNRY